MNAESTQADKNDPKPRRSLSIPRKKLSEFEQFESDLLTYRIQSYPKNKLFQGIRQGSVCKICCSTDGKNDDKLVKCSACGDHVHSICLNNNNDESYVQIPEQLETDKRRRASIKIRMEVKQLCNECQPSSICFVCKEASETELTKCGVRSCGRHYHNDCLDNWKQSQLIDSMLKCPLHVCHTCFAKKIKHTSISMKMTFCVKCPTAYHVDSCCIPAGTIILSQQQHICIRHRSESLTLPSLDWCFRCGEEGEKCFCLNSFK